MAIESVIDKIQQKSLFTAIKTPFNRDGSIDISQYDCLVEHQIQAGVDGLIVGGTTGEGHLLDWEEHLMLIAHSASKYGDKLIIVGNTGSNNTREAMRATEFGFASGMHASLQINPYYGKTTAQGVFKHIDLCLDIGPAIVYNVPTRTGQDIEPAIMEQFATHRNFIGVKECAGSERIGHYEDRGIVCWSGNDDQAFVDRHRMKSHGVISVASNIVPKLIRRLMDKNDTKLNQALAPLFKWLFSEPNPAPLNTALCVTGAIKPVIRLPYLPMDSDSQAELIQILSLFESIDVVGDKRFTIEYGSFTSIP